MKIKKFITIMLVTMLTVWEGAFSLCTTQNICTAPISEQTVAQQDNGDTLFSVCGAMNQQTDNMMNKAGASGGWNSRSCPGGESLPLANGKIVQYAFLPSSISQNLQGSSLTAFLSFNLGSKTNNAPPYALGLLCFLLVLCLPGSRKFSSYLPRSGIDSLMNFVENKNIKNPHWTSKINEGFLFVINYSTNGGCYV